MEKENPGSNEKETLNVGVEIIHDRKDSVHEWKQPEELVLVHEEKMFSLLENESSMEKENPVPIVKETLNVGGEFTHDRTDPVHEVKKAKKIQPRKRFVTTKFECAVCNRYFAYKQVLPKHNFHVHNEVKQPEEKKTCKEDTKSLFEAKVLMSKIKNGLFIISVKICMYLNLPPHTSKFLIKYL